MLSSENAKNTFERHDGEVMVYFCSGCNDAVYTRESFDVYDGLMQKAHVCVVCEGRVEAIPQKNLEDHIIKSIPQG